MALAPDISVFAGTRSARAGVFETLESVFLTLTCAPSPLALYGGYLGAELPERLIPLHLLRLRLSVTPVSGATRAAVWSALVRRARGAGPAGAAWTVGLAGTALPELVHILCRTAPGYPGPVDDLQAAAVAGLVAEAHRLDPTEIAGPRIRHRLLTGAQRATLALREVTQPSGQPATRMPGCTPAGGRTGRLDRATHLGRRP